MPTALSSEGVPASHSNVGDPVQERSGAYSSIIPVLTRKNSTAETLTAVQGVQRHEPAPVA